MRHELLRTLFRGGIEVVTLHQLQSNYGILLKHPRRKIGNN